MLFPALIVLVLGGSAAAQPAQAPAARRADPIGTIEDRTAGMKKIDGFFPLYWDESRRAVSGWRSRRFNTEVLHVTGLGAGLGLERHRARSRPAVRLAHRHVRARRTEGADGPAELSISARDQRQSRRSTRRARRVRALGAVGIPGGGRERRPRARRRDRLPGARRARHRRRACARARIDSRRAAARSTCR